VLGGEALGAFTNKINVGTLAENLAGGANWIAKMLDASDTAAAEGGAFHDEGIELHAAIAIEEAATAGVESFVILKNHDCFFDSVEGGASLLEHGPAGAERVAHTVEVRIHHVVGDRPGAPMN
jgi:hypothetical protein